MYALEGAEWRGNCRAERGLEDPRQQALGLEERELKLGRAKGPRMQVVVQKEC